MKTQRESLADEMRQARITIITSEEIKFLFDSWPKIKKPLWRKLLWWK